MSTVEITGLVKQWGDTRAVDGVSFVAAAGSLTALLGPSGCGKSTILRMVSGLEPPTEGHVRIGGRDVTRTEPAGRGVSMVFQSYALFPHLSVEENIVFGLKVRRISATDRARRLAKVADMVGLSDLLDRKPSALSGGQRQRVALARAVIAENDVCLMDEPLSNLDAKLRTEMRTSIRDLQRRLDMTMIYVTHDQTEAMTMADQIVLLNDGKVEQAGTPEQLYDAPSSVFTAAFIGMPPMNLLTLERFSDGVRVRGDREGPALAFSADSGWRLGVRPEHVALAPGSPVIGTVAAKDYLGADTLVTLEVGQERLTARIAGRPAAAIGERVGVQWPEDAEYLFDAHGRAVSRGSRTDGQTPVRTASA